MLEALFMGLYTFLFFFLLSYKKHNHVMQKTGSAWSVFKLETFSVNYLLCLKNGLKFLKKFRL